MGKGLAIIGNCSYSAILKEGAVEWMCWPRPDSSFVFGPILDREKGEVKNAAARVSEAGFPVGLVSGDTEGARYLPVHAAMAVRYGMDPTEALKAITIYPAKMFRLDDRIGSLKRGKDADFVVFSGNPLEMTSRVKLVVVNGKVVVDNRAEEK